MTEHLFTASQQQIDLAEVEYDSTDQCFQDIELINSVDIEVCFLFKFVKVSKTCHYWTTFKSKHRNSVSCIPKKAIFYTKDSTETIQCTIIT